MMAIFASLGEPPGWLRGREEMVVVRQHCLCRISLILKASWRSPRPRLQMDKRHTFHYIDNLIWTSVSCSANNNDDMPVGISSIYLPL